MIVQLDVIRGHTGTSHRQQMLPIANTQSSETTATDGPALTVCITGPEKRRNCSSAMRAAD